MIKDKSYIVMVPQVKKYHFRKKIVRKYYPTSCVRMYIYFL